MSTTHTPGPWAAHHDHGWLVVESQDEALYLQVEKGSGAKKHMADARLIAAAPDLLAAQTMGAEINTPDFLDWIAERLIHVHGESPHVDYVLSLRERAKAGRAALAKATGAPT